MPRWLAAITLLVFFGAVLAAALVNPSETTSPARTGTVPNSRIPNPESRIPAPPPLPVPLIGFTLNLHHNNEHAFYQQAVEDLAKRGFNAIQFTVPVFQRDGQASEIHIETGPGRGPRSDRLIDLIRRARERGMTVILTPIVLLTNPRGDEWRGKLSPQDWSDWWANYRRVSEHFLDIASENDVQVYVVGSELLTTESQSHRWQAVIAAARSRFRGQLTYASHWDRYDVPAFWKQLDLVSVNEYFDVTEGGKNKREDAALAAAWSRRREALLAFADSVGKPLLFTELGYPSLPWALEKPWKYTHDGEAADHEAQAAGYRAFLNAWGPLPTNTTGTFTKGHTFAGVVFYEWDPYRHGGPTDTHYGIRGKPAEELFRQLLESRQ